jgi:ATP-dependent Clp protease ATP-binding subunit ClpX
VQNELLPYIDEYGKELSVEREISSGKNKTFKVNTKDILFICMGAFAELTLEKNEECVITTSEIIRYGFLPEIVGRLPIIATYQPHTTDSLTRILKESRNSQVAQARTLLSAPYYNITLEFTNSAYEAIAEIAMKSKTGARSLSPIVQEIIRHIKTNKHLYQGTTLTITREIVKNTHQKRPNEYNLPIFYKPSCSSILHRS